MNKPKLGFITPGGLIGLAISVVLIILAVLIFGNQIFSPGGLNQNASGQVLGGISSHAELAKACNACHPAPWSIPDQNDLCLDCHQEIAHQLMDSKTLHGAVWTIGVQAKCRDCHTEHLGPDSNLTSYGGEGFPHELVGFSLTSHNNPDWDRDLSCLDCHPTSLQYFAKSSCQNCHLEINGSFMSAHINAYGPVCLACHDGRETINNDYAHDQGSFLLEGAHQKVTCEACHAGSTTLDGFKQTSTTCLSCHEQDDVHQKTLGESCEECHSPAGWIPTTFDHLSTGFPLTFGHSGLECSDCHEDRLTFQGTTAVCFSCHEADDPHQHLFGETCNECHNTIRWGDVSFDHTGPYTQYCSACHLDDKPQNHYPGECSACHQTSAWLPATFDHAVAGAVDCQSCHIGDQPANHYPGQCSFCHNTNAWLPAYFSHTFPLNHGGAGSTCSRCHTSSNYYSYTCYVCHEHNKTEIKKEHEGVSNLANCVRCHPDGRKHEDGNGGGDDD